MIVRVDRDRDEPIYGQIAQQIRDLVASGRLVQGTVLPAVRVLASDLGVNLNTVARAYRQLEAEGFLRIRGRAGAQVIAPLGRVPSDDRRRLIEELRALLTRMRQAGFGPAELDRVARREIASLRGGNG